MLRVTPLDGASHSLMKDYEESHYTGGSDTTLVEELARKDTEIDLLRKKLEGGCSKIVQGFAMARVELSNAMNY